MKNALIVSGDLNNDCPAITSLLKASGYSAIKLAGYSSEAKRSICQNEFNLIIIDTPLPDEFGFELAISISELSSAGIILICKSFIADDISVRLTDAGVHVLTRPISNESFRQALKTVRETHDRMNGVKKENTSLLAKIDEMRLINRAKCTLMQYLKFTEPQAHKYIEKQAMNNRQTRREVALKILAAYEKIVI